MNVHYGVSIHAPQTTGHPAALPADPPAQASDQVVTEVAENAGADETAGRNNQDATDAPPTAIQRKIMELLEQQADDLNQT